MPDEPGIKRAVSFFDGQNLYRHAKDAFGHHHPNYDPRKLADAICADRGWVNHGVRFYSSSSVNAPPPFFIQSLGSRKKMKIDRIHDELAKSG